MSTENTDVRAEIVSVKTLLTTPLTIPDYQRPYKWQARQVNQLLDDLIQHRDKSSYRLSTCCLRVKRISIQVVEPPTASNSW